MALTILELKALTAADHGQRLTDGGSLKGKVYAARDGAVSVQFRFAYKFGGKFREVLVGTWPKADITAIRRDRDALRVKLQNGIDPVAQSQLAREQVQSDREADHLRLLAEREAEFLKIEADRQEAVHQQQLRLQALAEKTARMSVRSLFEQWQRLELVKRADKGSEAQRSFERDVFPLIGGVAAADVTKAHIHEIVDTIKSRATAVHNMVRTAKKTLADMRQMFGFALDRDYVDADPTARVKKARIGADVERDRVLSVAELILLFQKLPKARLAITCQMALLIQLATAARIGEVLAARWEHVDFERRSLTLPETKNGKRHEIWLSDFALRQLKTLHENTGLTAWLFPASQAKNDQPDFADHVCVKTVTKQVGDRQRPGGVPMTGRSKDVEALVLPDGKWTPHDLRRTAATTMAELGALPDVVEKCLNHTEVNKVKRIYQRAQYQNPMREAWRLLGIHLNRLENIAADQTTKLNLKQQTK
ncbi:Prophage integrase IntA [Polaromonas vacuolata]|uniref:Prophage integrase IntA n=1 Tax=Polaromonas vacuolata TaxID=37448 RepID=A0A6H2H9N1_9BURK|nr:site-specific integrase [Polaromonas vacuolata]QJC56579.1 Prophage integrase IntA [Polaromonas vacuolata]